MLDVIHYFLDQDMRYSTPEELQMHNSVRKTIFKDLYQKDYVYASEGSTTDQSDYSGTEVKPYIPPTAVDPDAFNPFGSILDAPIA